MDRSKIADFFLKKHHWGDSNRLFLAGDCSFRRYERVIHRSKGTAVLMDAPPPEDPERFVFITNLLHQFGLRAPRVYAQDLESGFLLLEDFGDQTYNYLLNNGHDPVLLYKEAVDVLITLHQRHTLDLMAGVSFFDLPRYLQEVELWTDWYWPAVKGEDIPHAHKQDFLAVWAEMLAPLEKTFVQGRASLVLRDYHVDNLIHLEGEKGVNACGLLDFQDALYGPMAYDLVSLLEDARRDVDPFFASSLKEYYLSQQSSSFDQEAFEHEYLLLGVQRATKIIGIFTRLAFRDQKPHPLSHIQRVWGYLEVALSHPFLAPLKKGFDHILPPSLRVVPTLERAA